MPINYAIPTVADKLPGFHNFIQAQVAAYQRGELPDWTQFAVPVRAAHTPEFMAQMDAAIPGWAKMCDYDEGQIMIHITAVMACLLTSPQYPQLAPYYQRLLEWIVVFHDLGKNPQKRKRDYFHPNISCAMTAHILPWLGFPTTAEYKSQLSGWVGLITTTEVEKEGHPLPDNRKLPQALAGIEALFGRRTPAERIVKSVLLHQSFSVLNDWPNAAPLTDEEIKQYLDPELFAVLALMHFADSDAWQLYDAEHRLPYQAEIRTNMNATWQLLQG